MITRKTKSLFKRVSKYYEPIFQIGKNGIEETFLKQLKKH